MEGQPVDKDPFLGVKKRVFMALIPDPEKCNFLVVKYVLELLSRLKFYNFADVGIFYFEDATSMSVFVFFFFWCSCFFPLSHQQVLNPTFYLPLFRPF